MRYRIYISIIFLLFIEILYAQKIDSLRDFLGSTTSDSIKLEALFQLSKILCNSNPDSGIHYANLILEIANPGKHDSQIAAAYSQLGFSHYLKGDYDKVLEYYRESAKRYGQIGSKFRQAVIQNNIGVEYLNNAMYDSASYYFNIAKENAIDHDSTGLLIDITLNEGLVYDFQGQYLRAFNKYTKARYMADSLKMPDKVAGANNDIGVMYYFMTDYEKALKYLGNAIKFWEKSGRYDAPRFLTSLYMDIGSCYGELDSLEKALYYHRKALKIDIQLGEKYDQAKDYHNIGVIKYQMGNIDSASYYLIMAQKLKEEDGNLLAQPTTYNWLARIYLERKDYIRARELLNKSYDIAIQTNSKEDLKDNAQLFYELEKHEGNYQSALSYFEQYMVFSDSLYQLEKVNTIQKLEMEYQFDKQEADNEILKKNNIIKDAQLHRHKQFFLFSLIGILVSSVAAFFFWRNYRLQKENTLLLDEQLDQMHILNFDLKKEMARMEADLDPWERILRSHLKLVGKEKRQILLQDIHFIKVEGNFVRVFTLDGNYHIVYLTLKGMLEQLPDPVFQRTHKSYIANLFYVRMRNTKFLDLGTNGAGKRVTVPLSNTYREHVYKVLDQRVINQ